jgi:hypothetical protein
MGTTPGQDGGLQGFRPQTPFVGMYASLTTATFYKVDEFGLFLMCHSLVNR